MRMLAQVLFIYTQNKLFKCIADKQ